MPLLTDEEKVALQRAVSVHGRDWDAIVATGALGARTAWAVRKASPFQWRRAGVWTPWCTCKPNRAREAHQAQYVACSENM